MKVKQHILSSLPLGTVYFIISGDIVVSSIAMITSVVVDFDHTIDYVITHRQISSLKKMVHAYENFDVQKNYLILHSWEAISLSALYLIFFPHTLLHALFVGCVFHIALDQIYNTLFLGINNVRVPYYFFIFRMKNNFDVHPLRKALSKDSG